MPVHLTAFVATIAVLAILPSANNASITRQTLMAGRRAGLLTVLGSSTGILVWTLAAAVGLSAVLLANPTTFQLLRLAGAVVLCVLGIQSLWSLRRSAPKSAGQEPSGRSFAVGVATSLGNPKAGVVAISLIPQFVTADGPVLLSSIALGALWAAISGTWFCVYVWLIDRGRSRVTRPSAHRFLQAATGVTLLALGVSVAVAA